MLPLDVKVFLTGLLLMRNHIIYNNYAKLSTEYEIANKSGNDSFINDEHNSNSNPSSANLSTGNNLNATIQCYQVIIT